jgi:hypothetical protein
MKLRFHGGLTVVGSVREDRTPSNAPQNVLERDILPETLVVNVR